jgi:hypothetical protein
MNNQLAQTICNAFDNRQFHSACLNTAKANAQEMLSGRTHYVDDSTLRYFNCRITSAQPVDFGMFFRITESIGRDGFNGKRGFRCVLFDINGQVVYRPSLEELDATSTKAEKTFYAWFESFNSEMHYQEKIREQIIRNNRQAYKLEESLEALHEAITA